MNNGFAFGIGMKEYSLAAYYPRPTLLLREGQ